MRIQSRSYNKNKRTRDLFRSIPLPLILRESEIFFFQDFFFKFEFVHLESGLFFNLFLFIIFPSLFFFYSLPSFLKSHRFDPVESDPRSH